MNANEQTTLFTSWVNQYADLLLQYTLRRFDDRALCEDIVQDTFYKAWRNISNYRGEASPKNWLFLILKSRIIDEYRKMASSFRSLAIKNDYYFDEEEHWKIQAYPSAIYDKPTPGEDFHQTLNECTTKLKKVQRVVFTMKYVDEMDSREICRILKITEANYWVLIHRAKVQLRHCLQVNWLNKST